MHKKLTITLDEKVYDGLHEVVGKGHISQFIENLTRPYVVREDIASGYQAMANNKNREKEADEWSESLIKDLHDEEG